MIEQLGATVYPAAEVTITPPPWYSGIIEPGGSPPLPPELPPEPYRWRPDPDLLLMGLQIAVLAFAVILDVMEMKGWKDWRQAVEFFRWQGGDVGGQA